ncbi:ZYRO0F06974p [Zygosaccharomyces rouxii]|uniref:Ribosome biogenesis protein NOP53 n=1 Tax=Zygosaccharomyces rouxii (strain ATCC 2623 / CBS 732 / NBRC 1130 / NCYC 568 / NRRL Y-229) TaxID=559307 RepID=C5DXQ6_ZYGRC|nr:uncharacterized protein ZYRO0F06974g [Zygosaccharomyces rouxii]KAH9199326.1 ribosome biogenesis protein Nop53/GLTSCR2 [Zygosaccharomyces rouxii]CAR28567.1 ZYRO0F06974p [Zygosaccharomyces rouxii]
MSAIHRPAQYKQSSRKGKKAWRKNIDVSDVEKGLQDKNELEITHGTPDLSQLQDDKLFQVDDQGDLDLKSKLIKRKQIKKNIRSREILDAVKTNSKVDIVKHPKTSEQPKDKIQNVSKKELQRLLNLAGKTVGESKWKNRVAKEGLIKSGSFDLWNQDSGKKMTTRAGIQVEVDPSKEIPKELVELSTTSWSLPSTRPSTLERAPEKVQEYEELPHAGKSYNPNEKDWNQLIMAEYTSEKAREDNRIAQREYSAKIAHLIEVLGDSEEEDSDSSEEEEENEQEEEGSSNEDTRLSMNEVVKNKKKTKYQRNKAKKHEERVKMQEELKRLKSHLRELEKLQDLEKEVEKKKPAKVQKTKKNKKHKLGTKYSAREANLEVKFSDELSDSLRKLRPEGNLLYDQMRKLQSSGKVETRIPVSRSKGNKPKVTEKWTYKDFK